MKCAGEMKAGLSGKISATLEQSKKNFKTLQEL
jgi:hypothetical protein